MVFGQGCQLFLASRKECLPENESTSDIRLVRLQGQTSLATDISGNIPICLELTSYTERIDLQLSILIRRL